LKTLFQGKCWGEISNTRKMFLPPGNLSTPSFGGGLKPPNQIFACFEKLKPPNTPRGKIIEAPPKKGGPQKKKFFKGRKNVAKKDDKNSRGLLRKEP